MLEAQSESREKVRSDDDDDDGDDDNQPVFDRPETHDVEERNNQKQNQNVLNHIQREIGTATRCFEKVVRHPLWMKFL